MSKAKRTSDEEIAHLKKKLQKLEENSIDREPGPSRTETFARRNSGDSTHLAAETRASLGDVEPHSPRDVPPVNANFMEVNSTRVEPRVNVNVTEPNSARVEPRANVNNNEANIMTSTSTADARKNLRTHSETSQPDNLDNNHVLNRNEALLNALGDDLSLSGDSIHTSLAQTWTTILRKGLPADIKEKLQKEYAVPDNCKLLKAPTLNEEVLAVVEYRARNRDKIIENKQNQLGLGIIAIGRAITVLLNRDENYEVNAMRHFNHGCRILLDLHYVETNSRKRLFHVDLNRSEVFHNLKIHDFERDETLFGNKVAKMVIKQGIIPSPHTRPSSSSYGNQGIPHHSWNEATQHRESESRSRFN